MPTGGQTSTSSIGPERGLKHKARGQRAERAGRFRLSLWRHLDAAMFAPSERATLGIAIVDRRHDRFGGPSGR